ncbi:ATP-binding protein [Dongia sp.]|uniref:ATP-binding protein n=1 Tax=Dongia sp. TaxID=1977262 RepID=UPI0035AE8A25
MTMSTEKIRERLDSFRDTFIPYAAANDAVDALIDHHKYGRHASGSRCMVLVGPSRVGKTAVLRKYHQVVTAKPRPTIVKNGVRIDPMPIVKIDVPEKVKGKNVPERLASAIGDPAPSRGSAHAIGQRFEAQAVLRGVECIIFDEGQHYIDRSRGEDRYIYESGDAFKNLLNRGLFSIVLAGTRGVEGILKVNEQLRGRSFEIIRLERFSFSTKQEVTRFCTVVQKFEQALGFSETSKLLHGDMPQRLFAASRGSMGHLEMLLEKALLLALKSDKPHIDKALLSDAYAKLSMWSDQPENPFRTERAPQYQGALDGGNDA